MVLTGSGENQPTPTPKSQPAEPGPEVPAQLPPPPAKAQTVESFTEAVQPALDTKSENPQANRALMDAVRDGNIETIKQQLAAGANVNAIDDEGLTPLDRF